VSEQFWTLLVNAAVTVVSVICGVIALWIKAKQNSAAIQQNTDITAKSAALQVKTAEAHGINGKELAAVKEAVESQGKP
jgi:hypothetical protein